MKATDLAILGLLFWAFTRIAQEEEARREQLLLHEGNLLPPSPSPRLLGNGSENFEVCPKHQCGGKLLRRVSDDARWCMQCQELYYATPEATGELGPDGNWPR